MYMPLEPRSTILTSMETTLNYLEKIIRRYKDAPVGIYIKGKREPYTDEDGLYIHQSMTKIDPSLPLPYNQGLDIVTRSGKLIIPAYVLDNKPDMVSTKPLHPLLVLDVVSDVLDYLLLEINPNKDLLLSNPIITDGESDCLITGYARHAGNVEDIISLHVNDISDEDQAQFNNILHKYIITPLSKLLEAQPDNYFRLSFVGLKVLFNDYGDIRALRYMESMDKMDFDVEINKQYEMEIGCIETI